MNPGRGLSVILGLLVAIAGCGDDPARLSGKARDAWKAGRRQEAEDALARLAAVRPLTVPERLIRAQVARDRGKIEEAVAALGRPTEGGTPEESALLFSTLGTLELLRNRFRSAEDALSRALALDPSRSEARRELINLYHAQGRMTNAEAPFRALEQDPSSPLSFADLFLWTVGRREDLGPAELAEALSKAVAQDPDDRRSRLALAENLRRLGRLEDAEASLKPLRESDPEARALMARMALDRGQSARAWDLLAEGSPGKATPAAVERLRGRLALAKGNPTVATESYRAALKSEPNDRDAQFGLAQALRLLGQTDAAGPIAESVKARDRLDWLVQNARPSHHRDDPKSLKAIGDACQALGRREQARAWYRLALTADPLNGDLQRALFRLK